MNSAPHDNRGIGTITEKFAQQLAVPLSFASQSMGVTEVNVKATGKRNDCPQPPLTLLKLSITAISKYLTDILTVQEP